MTCPDLAGAPRAELPTTFTPTLAVGAARVDLVVHTDVTSWFKTRSGSVIHPSTGANVARVAVEFRRSFRAFRDDAPHGRDDADHHGST